MVKLLKIIGDAYFEISEYYYWLYWNTAKSKFRDQALAVAYYACGIYSTTDDSEGIKKSKEIIRILSKHFSDEVLETAINEADSLEYKISSNETLSSLLNLPENKATELKKRFIQGSIVAIEEE